MGHSHPGATPSRYRNFNRASRHHPRSITAARRAKTAADLEDDHRCDALRRKGFRAGLFALGRRHGQGRARLVRLRHFAAGPQVTRVVGTARAVNADGSFEFRVSGFVFKPETRHARPETYSTPFCVHQGTMEPMRQVAPALWRQDSKNSLIFGSSSSYSICVPPSLTLTSIGLSSPRATKL